MEIIVDGASDFKLAGDPPDVLAAVVAVGQFLQEQKRTLVSVTVDGDALTPEGVEDDLRGKPLAEVNRLEVTSEEVGVLVDECLALLEKTLPELPVVCRELAGIFQGDKPEEGYEPFRQMTEIWEHVKIQQLQVIGALGLDWTALEIGGKSLEEFQAELNAILQEAIEVLQAGDNISLGDLLEYELAPRAETEAGVIAALQEQARAFSG